MAFPPYILREKDLKLQRRARGEGGSWPNLESKGGGAGNQPWTRLNNGGGPRGGAGFTHEDEKKSMPIMHVRDDHIPIFLSRKKTVKVSKSGELCALPQGGGGGGEFFV